MRRQAEKYSDWGVYKGAGGDGPATFNERFHFGGGSSAAGGATGGTGATSKGESNSARTGVAMAAAMDQLRKEGVPEANLKYAAALMVGQGLSESGLNANASHDGGTGYGIYGARLGRLKSMRPWLTADGYPQNSLVGQAKFMVHEAMTGSLRPNA